MKKLISFCLFILVTSVICSFLGCNEDNCSLTTNSVAHFDFLSSDSHSTLSLTTTVSVTASTMMDITVQDTLSDGSIVEREVKDSLVDYTVYNQISGLSSFSLPMSYSTKTRYVIQYSDILRDVIEITHRPIPFVSDLECGTLMFYEIEDITYTTNVLDSIETVNPNVDNEEKTNFHIYYTIAE